MRRIAIALLLIVGFSRSLPASADPLLWNGQLTKAQSVARALTDGFDSRIARIQTDTASAQALRARAALLPSVSVSGTQMNANLPQLGLPVARQTYVSATATVPILQASASLTARAAGEEVVASNYDLVAKRNDVVLDVVRAYDRAVLDREIVAARQAELADQQTSEHLVQLRFDAGKVARFELTRARSSLAVAQQAAEDAQAAAAESLNDLKVALNLSIDSSPVLVDQIATMSLADSQEAVAQRAVRQRPDLLAADARLSEAKRNAAAARAQYAPTLSVSGQTYNGSSTPPLGTAGSQVGLVLSVPLITGGLRRAALLDADADVARFGVERERTLLQVQADAANAWREFEAAQRNVTAAQSAAADAAETLRVALLRQQSGKNTQLEVLDALAASADAREKVLRAEERLDIAVAAVHHVAGDPP